MPAVIAAPGAAQSYRDTLPPAERDWLRRRTEDIVGFLHLAACDVVRIGLILREARERIKHGAYEKWVTTELPFSLKTAHRYQQVAAAFGKFQIRQFDRFDPGALYVLAQLNVPETARACAVQLVEGGTRITHALALEIIDANRPDAGEEEEEEEVEELPPENLKELRCLGLVEDESGELVQCPAYFPTTSGKRFCPACLAGDAPPTCAKPTSPELLAKRWSALEGVFKGGDAVHTVHIVRVEDTDSDEPLYCVTCYREGDLPGKGVRQSLYDALAVAAGKEETRFCSGYKPLFPFGHDAPVSQFGVNQNNPGGLMYRCRRCEKARRAAMRAAEKAARAEEKRLRLAGNPAA